MSIKEVLFSGITDAEKTFLQEMWGSFDDFKGLNAEENYEFRRLINLVNNEVSILDAIEVETHGLYHYLPKNCKNLKPHNLITLIKEYKPLGEQDLQILSSECAESSEVNPELLFLKLRMNLFDAIEPYCKKWVIAFNEMRDIQEFSDLNVFLRYNTEKFSMEVNFALIEPMSKNKPWLDIRKADDYFKKDIRKSVDKITQLTSLNDETKNKIILCMNKKNERALPEDKAKELQDAILSYHQIAKDKPKNISKRRKALIHISKLIDLLLVDPSFTELQKETLKEIQHQSKMKSDYLGKIYFIPHLAIKRIFRLEHVKQVPLVVDKPDWFSDLDPLHRIPPKLYHLSHEKWWKNAEIAEKKKIEVPNFWLWLEAKDEIDLNTMEIDKRYSVPILDTLVTIQEGICYNKKCSTREDGKIDDGIYLYSISKDNNFHILPTPPNFRINMMGDESLRGKGVKSPIPFNHNAMLHGASVQCAGCVVFKNGKILKIDTNSGHYQPHMKNLQNVVRNILSLAEVFTEDSVVTDYDATKFVPVAEFINERFDIRKNFPKGLPRLIKLQTLLEKTDDLDLERMQVSIRKSQKETKKAFIQSKARTILRQYVSSMSKSSKEYASATIAEVEKTKLVGGEPLSASDYKNVHKQRRSEVQLLQSPKKHPIRYSRRIARKVPSC